MLEDTNRSWIIQIVKSFNAGDIDEYERLQVTFKDQLNAEVRGRYDSALSCDRSVFLIASHVCVVVRPSYGAQPVLLQNVRLLTEKISVLALMELVFKRPSENRAIPFSVIAEHTKLAVNEVELLVMKALSLKLVKGAIDQVDQVVTFTWVQPRVLDLAQVCHATPRHAASLAPRARFLLLALVAKLLRYADCWPENEVGRLADQGPGHPHRCREPDA